jgi:cytoplasmic iron level regulating protein YaaA (DUF328/UPF0246 family)
MISVEERVFKAVMLPAESIPKLNPLEFTKLTFPTLTEEPPALIARMISVEDRLMLTL